MSNPKEYLNSLPEADALVVRSAVKVTKEVLEQGAAAARDRARGRGRRQRGPQRRHRGGRLVMNTPGGNAASVAEHTIALMLAMARSIPQASASTKAGKWEKKKFLGNEIARQDAGRRRAGQHRARGGEARARLRDADPGARPLRQPADRQGPGCRTGRPDALYAESDYITLHVALTPETQKLISREAFAQMKTGVRIVNCARGETDRSGRAHRSHGVGQGGRRRTGCVQAGAPRRRTCRCWASRACWRRRTSRGVDRRGAGDRGRQDRRADRRVSEERRGHQRGQHARHDAGAVPAGRAVYRPRRAAGVLRRAYRPRQPGRGALRILGQDRRRQHAPDPQRGPGGAAQSLALAEDDPGERHADGGPPGSRASPNGTRRRPRTWTRSPWNWKRTRE